MLQGRVAQYNENRDRLLNGGITCIPFKEHFPALSKVVPGIMRSTYYAVTSYTNVGKTPLAKYMFVLIPFYYYLKFKGTANEFNLRILYFCLEETEEQFIDSLVIAELYNKYGILIDYNELNSFDKPLNSDILQKIRTLKNYFHELEKVVDVISGITSADGIMKIIRSQARRNGKFYVDEEEVDGYDFFTHYVPNDPSEHVIIIVDHINILSGSEDLRKTMAKFSTEYMLQECIKQYNYSVCVVHQQAAEGESAEYNKFNKNECSLTTLGDNKTIARDYMVVFGLDMPQRYGITEHNGFKLRDLDIDKYRSITLLKNRFGKSRVRKSVMFTPQSMTFEELPNAKN